MCGLFASVGVAVPDAHIDRLAQRGPDGAGRREFATPAGPLVLGHRRLAIIDPDPRSDQPMSCPEGRLHIVFNGEIYNYLELRDELRGAGFRFHTGSDTEVLLAAYAAWGSGMLERLIGMFAFALFDRARGRLFLARDRFGMKPLYYASGAGGFACASEMKALFDLPFVSRRLAPQPAFEFLRFGMIEHRPETLFRDIRLLRPAHWMEVDLTTVEPGSPVRYWTPRAASDRRLSFEEAAESLRERFDASVRLHLRSDVPVGATLSGGIDSTAVVTSIVRQSAGRLPTFSFISEDPALSEDRWIDLAAQGLPLDLHKVQATLEEFRSDLDRLIDGQDVPLQSPSIYAEYKVYELARRTGIKVVLGGQGADEMFAGYHPYMLARIGSLIAGGRLPGALGLLNRYRARSGMGWRSIALTLAAGLLPEAAIGGLRRARPSSDADWLDHDWAERQGVDVRPMVPRYGRDGLRQTLLTDFLTRSLPAHLRYEDHNSMMHGVESRVPFLTQDIAELAFSLPENALIDDQGRTKAVLRHALADRLPAAIRDRADKIGFAAPDRSWLLRSAPWVEALLGSGLSRCLGPIRPEALRERWQGMLAGHAPVDTRLWRVLTFIRWAELKNVEVPA
ncbi:asparagine synthase (glutamine-hydrolyzing) [Caenispirillum bisanense]